LAQDEDKCNGLKVSIKYEVTYEEIEYIPITVLLCQEYIMVIKETFCEGTGTICCIRDYEVISSNYGDYCEC
jgi:hypothetical protein